MIKKNLFIALDGVVVQRNEKKFSAIREAELIEQILSSSEEQTPSHHYQQLKQFPQFKQEKFSFTIDFDIEYYLSREARISSSPRQDSQLQSNLSHLQSAYSNNDLLSFIDYQIVPKVKNTLKNLGDTYKRVLIIQSVSHDRTNKIFSKFKDQFQELIDAYLFITAQKGALCKAISNYLRQDQSQEIIEQEESFVFISNSMIQLFQVKAKYQQIKTIFFNRNLSSPRIIQKVIREQQINNCFYDFSSMTMINLERLIKNVIEKVKNQDYDKLLRIGLLYTRHQNTKAKWDKVNNKNFLLNDQTVVMSYIDIFLPLNCQQKVDLMIHKLPIHFIPYDLKNHPPLAISQKTKDMQSKIKFYEQPDLIKAVSGRSYFRIKLNKILQSQSNMRLKTKVGIQLKNPKWFLLSEGLDPLKNQAEFLQQISVGMKKNQLKYPIIIQSDNATAHASSHNLALIKSESGLKNFINKKYFELPRDGPNLIVQQFIEHNSSILKVYMLEANEFFGVRIDQSISAIKMNDQEVFYLGQSEKKLGFADKLLQENKQQDIQMSLHKLLGNIVKQFGIKIVGFDVIRKVETQQYYIIDINHFPSFDKLPSFPNKFREVLIKQAQKEHDARMIQNQLD